MPVQKFRDLDSAREALWRRPDDPGSLRRAAWLWAFSARLCPPRIPPGVQRYRSIEDAQRAREAWGAPIPPQG